MAKQSTKNRRSKKNLAIGLLILTNFLSGAYIIAKEHGIAIPNSALKSGLAGSTESTKSKGAANSQMSLEIYRKKALRPVTAKHAEELQSCYQVYLADEPLKKEGKVVAQWRILGTGEMTELELMRNDIENDEFQSCVTDSLSQMVFAPPPIPEGTLVSHTFSFKKSVTK